MAAPVHQLFPDGRPPDEEPVNPVEEMPPPSNPLAVARILLEDSVSDGHLLLRRWRGDWWSYEGPHWVRNDAEGMRKVLYYRLENAVYKTKGKGGDEETKSWSPNKGKIDNLLDALKAPTYTSEHIDPPTWLSTGASAAGVVPCLNGLVDTRTRQVHPTTPDYFGTTAIPIQYDADAPEPTEWLSFLRTCWPEGDEEIRALRMWFGYILSGRMDLQKMCLLLGPPRCGKGTIARILIGLIGQANHAAPTLAGMSTNFGMQELIGKTLAVIGDARLPPHGQEAVVERLLTISGQDSITADRKNRDPWTGRLQTRFMVLSNELPKFGDASGAIASRFVILRMTQSFLGKEDHELEARCREEYAGILKWALDGVTDLNSQGRIVEPATSQEARQELSELVSPVSAFLRTVCVLDPDEMIPFQELYRHYGEWCRENTRGLTNSSRFSADLKARVPDLQTDYRPRTDPDPNGESRRLPRHVRGLSVKKEWTHRIKDTELWRYPTHPDD